MVSSNASQNNVKALIYLVSIHKSWILFLVLAYTAVKLWQMTKQINTDSIIKNKKTHAISIGMANY